MYFCQLSLLTLLPWKKMTASSSSWDSIWLTRTRILTMLFSTLASSSSHVDAGVPWAFYVIRPSAFPFCPFPLHPCEHLEKSIPWGPFCRLTHICCFLPIPPTKPFGKYYLTRNVTARKQKFLLSVVLVDRKYLATLNCFLPKTLFWLQWLLIFLCPFPDPSPPDAICIPKSSVPFSFVCFALSGLPSLTLQHQSTAQAGPCSQHISLICPLN